MPGMVSRLVLHNWGRHDRRRAMATTRRALTLDEFLALPEEEISLEYEDGRITRKVPPMGKHAAMQMEVGRVFNEVGMPRRIARAFSELRTTFAGFSRV